MRADDARWFVSTIVRKMASREVDRWGLVRLNATIIRRVMYQGTYKEVIENLLSGAAVERAPYKSGEASYGYRLSSRYLGDHCRTVPATDARLIARIEQERQRVESQQARQRRPIHDALADEQRFLTITPEADDIVQSLAKERARLCQSILVSDIRHRRLRFTLSSTGRIYNAISGLKRELRSTLRLAGEPLGGIDLRASQPSLLAMILSKTFPPTNELEFQSSYNSVARCLSACLAAARARLRLDGGTPDDVVRFAADACGGRLYEQLADLVGLSRKQAKQRLLVDVLAKRGGYPSSFENAFRAAYPSVHAAIRKINDSDHCSLIRLLQTAEAWLIIDQVCPLLLGEGIRCVTLHDCVFSQVGMLDRVEMAFEDTFANIGFRLGLKREIPGSLEARSDPSADIAGDELIGENVETGQSS